MFEGVMGSYPNSNMSYYEILLIANIPKIILSVF
jgi:hypothetical protein